MSIEVALVTVFLLYSILIVRYDKKYDYNVQIVWTNIKMIIGESFIFNDLEVTCCQHPPTSRLDALISGMSNAS